MSLCRCIGHWGLVSHPKVHLRSLTRFLFYPSRGSICGPHGPVAGLSHAPSAQAAWAQCTSRYPSPASSATLAISSSHFYELQPFSLFAWLPACLSGAREWKLSYGQTSVNFLASPCKPSPRSTNNRRATRTCLTLCPTEHANGTVQCKMKEKAQSVLNQAGNWE